VRYNRPLTHSLTSLSLSSLSLSLSRYAAHRLYRALSDDTSQQGLLHVGVWCLGEYGELLIRPCAAPDAESEGYAAVGEHEVLALLDRCLKVTPAHCRPRSTQGPS